MLRVEQVKWRQQTNQQQQMLAEVYLNDNYLYETDDDEDRASDQAT